MIHTLTRWQPPNWTGYARRVGGVMLAEIGPSPSAQPRVYVCGPTPFVEAVATALVDLGHEPPGPDRTLRTDRRVRWMS